MEDWVFRSIIGSLDHARLSLDRLSHFWTSLVIIGVALELVSIAWDHNGEWADWKAARTQKVIPLPGKPRRLKLTADLLSVALVVGGIWGELSIDIRSERLETLIGEVNDLRAQYLQRAANSAEESAERAQNAADATEENYKRVGGRVASLNTQLSGIDKKATEVSEKLADRTLSDQKVKAIGVRLAHHPLQEYDVTAYWDSPESVGIANRIHLGLQEAGWKFIPMTAYRSLVGVVVGVVINVHPKADKSTLDAANDLWLALQEQGLQATIKLENPQNPKSNIISLSVGSKR